MKNRFIYKKFSFACAFLLLTFGTSFLLYSQSNLDEVNFRAPLNTQNVEYNPIISPKGHYIVFQSNRPGGKGGMDIWISTNQNYPNRIKLPDWTQPENFSELNTSGFEGMFSILFGKEDDRPEEIYFTSLRSTDRDGYDGLNIYFSERIKNSKNWKIPVHLDEINSNFNDRMPAISPDGKILIFSSDRPGGFGGFDLWVSFRYTPGDKWSEPINMGKEINTNYNEISPSFHWDGETLYFSSDREDKEKKFKFYLTNWKEDDHCRTNGAEKKISPYRSNCWDSTSVLGYPFNTDYYQPETSTGALDRYDPIIPISEYRNSDNEGISITHDDLWVYYSSNRPGGRGQFDIYRAPMPDSMRKSYDFIFHGLVLDGSEKTMIGLDSTIKIQDEVNPSKVITTARIGGDLIPGEASEKVENFRTTLKTGRLYRVEVSSPGFYPADLIVDLRGNTGRNKSRYETVILEKVKPITPIANKIELGIYDKKTEKKIETAIVTIFTQTNRSGLKIENKDGIFILDKTPEEDFEILAQAKNYKDDTFFFKTDNIEEMVNNETKLYLTNLADIDKIYSTIILFPFNIGDISAEDKLKLDKLAEYMIAHPNERIEIGGHTDNVASKEYNMKLSYSRADSVLSYLIKKGVPRSQMETKAYYYSQPAEDNSTAEGRSKNRRVNFKKLK